jgi:hypothetical protein
MKKSIKLPLTVLSVGAVIALALFGWSAKAKNDATFHLANGVEITPIEVKSDDMAQLLEAKIWQFDVMSPAKANSFAGIALCQIGQPSKTLAGGIGIGSGSEPNHSHITVGLVPIAGTFFDAQKLKYSLAIGIESTTGTIPNPFIHSHGFTQDAQVIVSDNRVLLMSGNLKKNYISSPASQNEMALALEFPVFHYKK